MYLDKTLMFSYEKAITATGASSVLHLGAEDKPCLMDFAHGDNIYPFVQIFEEFAGLTTLEVQVQCSNMTDLDDDDEPIWKTIASSGAITQDKLNEKRIIQFGSLAPSCDEYVRLNYVVAGTPTAGKVNAALVLNF